MNHLRTFKCVVVMLICAGLLVVPSITVAKGKVVQVEGVAFDVNASMKDNLKSLVGKRVYVSLNSGKTFSGTLKAVGKRLIHIEKLDGKDYFDALIKIDTINAIDTRFREFKRKK